ncbi:hypothetical protein GCM10009754_20500 [Amycolatopsis minnesotensis]|uniref:Uncharacterized protein n=1 Tax=Amycolatopsis minnesotensis TaxID=337894 RepID=A0ABN2QFW4_9PSEU
MRAAGSPVPLKLVAQDELESRVLREDAVTTAVTGTAARITARFSGQPDDLGPRAPGRVRRPARRIRGPCTRRCTRSCGPRSLGT